MDDIGVGDVRLCNNGLGDNGVGGIGLGDNGLLGDNALMDLVILE